MLMGTEILLRQATAKALRKMGSALLEAGRRLERTIQPTASPVVRAPIDPRWGPVLDSMSLPRMDRKARERVLIPPRGMGYRPKPGPRPVTETPVELMRRLIETCPLCQTGATTTHMHGATQVRQMRGSLSTPEPTTAPGE